MKTKLSILNFLVVIFSFLLFSCSKENTFVSEQIHLNKNGQNPNFPEIIALPNGHNPEGIVAGKGNDLYAGSLYDGSIYKADRRTGMGHIVVQGFTDRISVGLDFDPRTDYLFAAGGPDGYGYIYNANTGAEVAAIQLSPLPFLTTFINDVFVTDDAAYFTNSFLPEFYKLNLNSDGSLASPVDFQTIQLSGDWDMGPGFNANGIVATDDGSKLIISNAILGILYLVDATTGVATEINIGMSVPSADGLVLRGNKLYVVQNEFNLIRVIQLSGSLTSGTVINTITHPQYRVPTTAAIKGNTIYAVNAKFDIAPPPQLCGCYDPTIPFEIVAVDLN